MSDVFIPIRENDSCDIDKIYLLPQLSEETCRWLNTLPQDQKWGWIAKHSAVIKNLKTGEVEK